MYSNSFTLFRTADGTETLYSAKMQESYHSLNGAAQESKHVFIDAGLNHLAPKKLHLFEVGFGTGLNALLSWGEAHRNHLDICYTAVEAFPLSSDFVKALHYDTLETNLPENAFQWLHQSVWGQLVVLEKDCFCLTKLKGDFTNLVLPEGIDLVYFDAFAPEKQPEMWEESLFVKLYEAMTPNGILVTYCAKGEVRRKLIRSGFRVERIPGPPGKREMIRAIKVPF
jgi:tRNA U34 5-methylaminomethyl-2-thiouridine-forming methyltransferase MnmC